MRLFRDRTNLGVTPELWGDIESALARSQWFILIASPEAAASPWIEREVRWWLDHRSADHLMIVVSAGVLRWDGAHNQIDPRSTAAPESLLTAITREPLWIDLSDSGDGSEPYSEAELERGVAAIAARIRGWPLDAVVGEHLRQQRRTRRVVASVLALMTALTCSLAMAVVVAVQQRNAADRVADRAAARGAILQSRTLRETQINPSLLTGIAALALAPGADARANLVATLVGTRYAGTLPTKQSPVTSVRFASAGRLAVTTQIAGEVHLWDVADPAEARLLSTIEERKGIRTAAFSPDRSLLALAGDDSTVTLWNIRDPARPTALSRLTGHRGAVHSVTFNAAGTRLYTGGNNIQDIPDDGVLIWDVTVPSRARRIGRLPQVDFILHIATESAGGMLAVAGASGVTLWSVKGDRPRKFSTIRSNLRAYYSAAFSPDGRLLITTSGERTVIFWDVTNPRAPRQISSLPPFAKPVFACDLSRDGRTLAVADGDGVVTLWAVANPARPVPMARLPGHADVADTVAISADGELAISGGADGRAFVWTTADRFTPVRQTVINTTGGSVTDLTVGPDDVAVTRSGDPNHASTPAVVSGYDLAGSGPARKLTQLPASTGGPLALSPDGRTLLTRDGSESVGVWNVGEPTDPQLLATIADVPAGDNYSWTVDGTTVLITGQTNAAAAAGGASLWNFADRGRPVRLTPEGFADLYISAGAISPDGRVLALVSNGQSLDLWDSTDPQRPHTMGRAGSHVGVIRSVAFDPSGQLVATGSNDQTVALWRMRERRRLTVLQGHAQAVRSVRFSPDGRMLASLDDAGLFRLWDIGDPASPVLLHTSNPEPDAPATVLSFNQDGQRIVVGRDDGRIEVWDLSTLRELVDDPLETACALTGRGLNQSEWARYIPDRPYRQTC